MATAPPAMTAQRDPQVPVEYQPNAAYTLSEVANNLKGVLPQSPTLSITPETWYFVK